MERILFCVPPRIVVAALLLFSGPVVVAGEPEGELAQLLEAVVRVHTEIPSDARTAAYLGTQRDGAGVVIDDAGLVVTIGYLITEAMGAEVTIGSGRVSRADVVGFDVASGLGLLRAAERLGGEADADRHGGKGSQGDAGGGRRRWWTGDGAARCRGVAPNFRRLLGIPS